MSESETDRSVCLVHLREGERKVYLKTQQLGEELTFNLVVDERGKVAAVPVELGEEELITFVSR